MRLTDLDERVLPRAAARLRRALDRAALVRDGLAQRRQALALDTLDRRFAGRRVLRPLRDRPVVALVVAVLVLTAAIGTATWQAGSGTGTTPAGSTQQSFTLGAVLGPKVGDATAAYERAAELGLVAAVRTSPSSPRVALVSFAGYRTPEQTDTLFSGYQVTRMFLRAPSAGTQASPLPVDIHGPLLGALRTAYAGIAHSRLQAARAYQGYVDTLKGSTTQDKAFRALYAAFARSSRLEARAYGRDCACVYAAVLVATPARLLTLATRPGVRCIEVAAAGLTVLQVQTQPLLPEVVGIVPRPSAGGLT